MRSCRRSPAARGRPLPSNDAAVQLRRCTSTPLYSYAAVQLRRCTATPVYSYASLLFGQELEQERVQFLRLVDPDEVPRARDDHEVRVRDLLREGLRDGGEVLVVVRADDDERRDLERRQRGRVRPQEFRLLVGTLQLERPQLLRAHLVAVLRLHPELQVELGRALQVPCVERLVLGGEVLEHLL